MSRTTIPAGRLVAAYIDDSQGRRVVLGERVGGVVVLGEWVGGVLCTATVVATHKGEARAVIRALTELLDELPDAPPEGAGAA